MATIYRNRQLMYLSVILFFYFASIGCLAPFLTTHMRDLGFSLSEISFINAVSAFFSLAGPILFGTLAERRHRYKSTTSFCILFGAMAYVALSFVPRFEKLHYRPLVDFDCEKGLRIERCVNWMTCAEALHPDTNYTTIKLSDCHYQCPRKGHFSPTYPLHICFNGEENNICAVYDPDIVDDSLTDFQSHLPSWSYREVAPTNLSMTNFTDVEEDVPKAHVAMCNFIPRGPIFFNQKTYQDITCRPLLEDCSVHCKVTFVGDDGVVVLARSCEEANGNPTTTFWSYLILRSIGDFCMLTAICLLDALTIWSTIDYEGTYGIIHVWAALGMASLAPFSGALLDHYSDMDGKVDFSPSAFLSAGLAVMACALVIIVPLHRQKALQFQHQTDIRYHRDDSSSYSTRKKRLHAFEVTLFMVVVLLLGTQWSVLFTFLPWLTEDIGCSSTMTGLAMTLMFGFSLPFLVISKNMVRNIGKANLLVFALLFYFTRFTGITFVTSHWWILPFALMGSFTLCVMWIAVVAYGQALAPVGYNLSMQYILNILHFGIGRGIGSLVGGQLLALYSWRIVFCGIGVVSGAVGMLYLTIYHAVLRRKMKTHVRSYVNGGSWYPLQDRSPNGDVKSHQSIVDDQDDDVKASPNRQSPKR